MTQYDTYIFDLDGTLLATLDDLAASTNYALAAHGMPRHSTDDIRRFVGNGENSWKELFPTGRTILSLKTLLPPSASTIHYIRSTIPDLTHTSKTCYEN